MNTSAGTTANVLARVPAVVESDACADTTTHTSTPVRREGCLHTTSAPPTPSLFSPSPLKPPRGRCSERRAGLPFIDAATQDVTAAVWGASTPSSRQRHIATGSKRCIAERRVSEDMDCTLQLFEDYPTAVAAVVTDTTRQPQTSKRRRRSQVLSVLTNTHPTRIVCGADPFSGTRTPRRHTSTMTSHANRRCDNDDEEDGEDLTSTLQLFSPPSPLAQSSSGGRLSDVIQDTWSSTVGGSFANSGVTKDGDPDETIQLFPHLDEIDQKNAVWLHKHLNAS